jgi:hypothetical protein
MPPSLFWGSPLIDGENDEVYNTLINKGVTHEI